MKLYIWLMAVCVITAGFAAGETEDALRHSVVKLWPDKVPGETVDKHPATGGMCKDGITRLRKVTDPLLTVYPAPADSRTGMGVIVCPGGGYSILAIDKEGYEIAEWLNSLGVTAFVLQYRVPNNRKGALQDLQRAVRIVRSRAAEWSLAPDMIGVMGFSAGGHLAAREAAVCNQNLYAPVDGSDNVSAKTDFLVLIYPAYLQQGKKLTDDIPVDRNYPPSFLFVADNDRLFAQGVKIMADTLKQEGVPLFYKSVPRGGHGFGIRTGNPAAATWPPLAEKWLHSLQQK